jgi:hypothetical protein
MRRNGSAFVGSSGRRASVIFGLVWSQIARDPDWKAAG